MRGDRIQVFVPPASRRRFFARTGTILTDDFRPLVRSIDICGLIPNPARIDRINGQLRCGKTLEAYASRRFRFDCSALVARD